MLTLQQYIIEETINYQIINEGFFGNIIKRFKRMFKTNLERGEMSSIKKAGVLNDLSMTQTIAAEKNNQVAVNLINIERKAFKTQDNKKIAKTLGEEIGKLLDTKIIKKLGCEFCIGQYNIISKYGKLAQDDEAIKNAKEFKKLIDKVFPDAEKKYENYHEKYEKLKQKEKDEIKKKEEKKTE